MEKESFLSLKAKQNFAAAKLLFRDYTYYSCSVHCIYYGCIQTAKHVLFTIKSFDDKKITRLYYLENNKRRKKAIKPLGSHEFLIKLVYDFIKLKSHRDANAVKNEFNSLKVLRLKGDYENELINFVQSQQALKQGEKIIHILKKLYLK